MTTINEMADLGVGRVGSPRLAPRQKMLARFIAIPAVAIMAITATWGTDSAAVDDPLPAAVTGPLPREDDPTTTEDVPTTTEDDPTTTEDVVDDLAEPQADPGATTAPDVEGAPAPVATPLLVPDPGNGDLRTDVNADVLPLAYAPPPPADTILDVAYGTDPAQRLDIFLPDRSDAPVVVYLHSGGWVAGDKQHVPDMVMRFVERGYAVVSVGYRLAPEHTFPAPVHDVKTAVRWIKAYGASNGSIDGDRMALYGASAGGHLATFTGATAGSFEPDDLDSALAAFDSTVDAVVTAVGPADLVTFYVHDNEWAKDLTEAFVGCSPCTEEELAAASPTSHLHADLPPAYFAYGAQDALIEVETQAIALATAWAGAGSSPSLLDLVDGLGHNLDESTVNQRAIEAFIDSALTDARRR